MEPVPHIIVCGAGLTGLATAWHLRRSGADVTVLDAADTVGGVVQSTRRDGYLVEHGPNSCTLTTELSMMVDALGLRSLLREASPQARRRYIVRDGRALAVPMSPLAMLRSPLLSFGAKLRLLREPFIARRTADSDESVADFVSRRLGDEPLTWAVDPFVSGVYAGDPAQLSVRHAFPRLASLEREYGSLLRGAIASVRRSRTALDETGVAPRRHTMVSFADGMNTLPLALADDIGSANVLRRTRVLAMADEDGRSALVVERDGARRVIRADAVVSTLPLHALAQIDFGADALAALEQLSAVRYPPVVSLALGLRRADVAHPLDGFGCLVPSAEHRRILGVLFSSTLFDGRAPDGHVLLTCFLGGVRQPDIAALDTVALTELIQPELAALLGVTGAPKFVQHTVWPHAIPQYNLGHDSATHAAETIESLVPGVVVDGQFRRGVSVGDCIASGSTIAARVLSVARRRAVFASEARERAEPVVTPITNAAVA
jgi:protoporphyrinogen/coproporphyrinogen III oxidase